MKIKDTLVVYLQERIIIFPLHLYVNTLITRTLNRLHEWEILSKKKISGKESYFNFFLEKEILDILLEFKIVYKDLNLKIFTIFKNTFISPDNLEFLKEDNFVLKSVIKMFKKHCSKYFISNVSEKLKFESSDKKYKNIKCGNPTGDELDFLIKITK
jgi:hypothetical protein